MISKFQRPNGSCGCIIVFCSKPRHVMEFIDAQKPHLCVIHNLFLRAFVAKRQHIKEADLKHRESGIEQSFPLRELVLIYERIQVDSSKPRGRVARGWQRIASVRLATEFFWHTYPPSYQCQTCFVIFTDD
ncbi:hypothetical protein CEXT_223511 [Caerostris extrusa]|uniref:Uncharacterized protein n=1 Tax=Caerostris extrusa TaxID=172846 RepID=A0AAV4XUP9_CAEEX|nr:hypothetical protein CEXT_223511 [Caerostris extrusa]